MTRRERGLFRILQLVICVPAVALMRDDWSANPETGFRSQHRDTLNSYCSHFGAVAGRAGADLGHQTRARPRCDGRPAVPPSDPCSCQPASRPTHRWKAPPPADGSPLPHWSAPAASDTGPVSPGLVHAFGKTPHGAVRWLRIHFTNCSASARLRRRRPSTACACSSILPLHHGRRRMNRWVAQVAQTLTVE